MPKKTPISKQSHMRRFVLERTVDASGVSGIGVVAEGVQLSDGKCVISWLSHLHSIAFYDNLQSLEEIHSHGENTTVKFIDK